MSDAFKQLMVQVTTPQWLADIPNDPPPKPDFAKMAEVAIGNMCERIEELEAGGEGRCREATRWVESLKEMEPTEALDAIQSMIEECNEERSNESEKHRGWICGVCFEPGCTIGPMLKLG